MERTESHVPENYSSSDGNDNNDIKIGPARLAATGNSGATAVDGNEGNVTGWYQVAYEGGVVVNSNKVTYIDTWSFVKYVSVVTVPRSRDKDETDHVVNMAIGEGIQTCVR